MIYTIILVKNTYMDEKVIDPGVDDTVILIKETCFLIRKEGMQKYIIGQSDKNNRFQYSALMRNLF